MSSLIILSYLMCGIAYSIASVYFYKPRGFCSGFARIKNTSDFIWAAILSPFGIISLLNCLIKYFRRKSKR